MYNELIASTRIINRRNFFASTISVLLLSGLSGCGGSVVSKSSISRAKGKVSVTVKWPARNTASTSRYIPAYAQSLSLSLIFNNDASQTYSLIVDRPNDNSQTQSVFFDSLLPVGNYTLNCMAHLMGAGQGSVVASGTTPVVVANGQTSQANISLVSTIQTLSILGQPLSVSPGVTTTLSSTATDSEGNMILLPGDVLQWAIISGSDSITLTASGQLTATAVGSAVISVSEQGAGITAQANVQVVMVAGGSADSGWSRARGGVTNARSTSGRGTIGQELWRITPAKGVPTDVAIAHDGTICFNSISDGSVSALDSTSGAVKWSVQLGSTYLTTPTVGQNDIVYALHYRNGDSSHEIVALSLKDGSVMWQYNLGNMSFGNAFAFSPLLTSDGYLCVVNGNNLIVLSANSGKLISNFTFSIPGSTITGSATAPVLSSGNIIYSAYENFIFSFNGQGANLSSFAVHPAHGASDSISSIILSKDDSIIYAQGTESYQDGHSDSILYAISLQSNAVIWNDDAGGTTGLGYGSSATGFYNVTVSSGGTLSIVKVYSGDSLISGSFDDINFIVLNSIDGSTASSTSSSNQGVPGFTNAIVDADQIFYTGNGPGIIAYSSDGTVKLMFNDQGGAALTPIAIDKNGVLYATTNTQLVAYK